MIAALYALATGNYTLKALCCGCPVVDLKEDKAGFLIIHNSTAMAAVHESYKYFYINIICIHNQTPSFIKKMYHLLYYTLHIKRFYIFLIEEGREYVKSFYI